MTITEAIKRLNLMIEKRQTENNEALKMAIGALKEKAGREWRK